MYFCSAPVPRCQPSSLFRIKQRLTDKQRAAIVELGFGGLLFLNIEEFPRDMLRILCRSFLPQSRVLLIGEHRVQLTAFDVYDVFGIPFGDLVVPISGYNDHRELKQFWRDSYGNGIDVTVPQIMDKMFENNDRLSGDDVFKKLFIMHVMCTLLTPSLSRKMDTKLVGVLEDINNIQKYDWCTYVLNHLGKTMIDYDDCKEYIPGCVLFLQLCYFHRYLFRGTCSPKSLPLIRHWTTELLKKRIREEGGEYGAGFLDGDYPITKHKSDVVEGYKFELHVGDANAVMEIEYPNEQHPKRSADVQVEDITENVQKKAADVVPSVAKSLDGGRFVSFSLPNDLLTDEEIDSIAEDVSIFFINIYIF